MFFQNVFTSDFSDRQFGQNFKIRPNAGRATDLAVTWNNPPFNLSGSDGDSNNLKYLKITFAFDVDFKNWSTIAVDVTAGASSASAVTPLEIITALNADSNFSGRFTANYQNSNFGNFRVLIRQTMMSERFRFYINNTGAETVLRFNARAGVDQLPSYYQRHTMDNVRNFHDSNNNLIYLDTSSVVNQNVVNNAVDSNGISLGYSYSAALADWQMFGGSYSNTSPFLFQKNTVDSSSRITQTIEYPAGAKVGDFAKKTTFSYTGSHTAPDQMAQIPYVLASGDLITP